VNDETTDTTTIEPLTGFQHKALGRRGFLGAAGALGNPRGHQGGLQVGDVGRFELGLGVGGGPGSTEATQEEGEPSHAQDRTDRGFPPVVGHVHAR